MSFGAVAIGRNEGMRLRQCLRSLSDSSAKVVVYVDSGSTDGSSEWAHANGVDVISLDLSVPFTAARARNAGFERLMELAPDIAYIQFVDGDCELVAGWTERAVDCLDAEAEVGAVCGRRRERYPAASVYNWLCDQEWSGPPGETRVFGGDVMIRAVALKRVNGYRDDLIAGEEPELAVRLRAAKWRIVRLEEEMTLHDAAITSFRQWWKRAVRGGYAFAQGADLHGAPPERHWVWESRRAWVWGIYLPLICLLGSIAFHPWGWALWLVYPFQVVRIAARYSGSIKDRMRLAFFHTLARFPEAWGQILFLRDRLRNRQAQLIEYK